LRKQPCLTWWYRNKLSQESENCHMLPQQRFNEIDHHHIKKMKVVRLKPEKNRAYDQYLLQQECSLGYYTSQFKIFRWIF